MGRSALAKLVAVGAATVILAGCGGASGAAGTDEDKPTVLTTFTVLSDIAQNIAGDHLNVQSITKPGAEIHGYEPTPKDIAKASDAELILDNGLGLEVWFKKFVAEVDVPHAVVSKGVKPMDITGDAYAGKPNPHAWMSPVNVQKYADNMVAAFSDLDRAHAADYRENGKAYKDKLQGVQDDLTSELSTLPKDQRALVSCEGAFSYLARDAHLSEKYIWPVNAEQQATPKQISSAIEFVKDKNVPAVFCESTVSNKPMQQVAKATNASFGGTLYVDSLSQEDGPVPTYLDLIRHDANTITKGLKGRAK